MLGSELEGDTDNTRDLKQLSLPEIRDIAQISSALNYKKGVPRLQRIVWDKKKFKYHAY